jgi:hypothetical protein
LTAISLRYPQGVTQQQHGQWQLIAVHNTETLPRSG